VKTGVTALVPPERDFRFASTQGPEDIHGGNPGTSGKGGQILYLLYICNST
jgi:hypothetical protein